MKIVRDELSLEELKKMTKEIFGDFTKAVVDVEREIMAIGGELHSDEESLLLQDGSHQKNLWGINLYPEIHTEDWIEFDSVINIRPSQGNYTRSVDSPEIRKKIVNIVNKLVKR